MTADILAVLDGLKEKVERLAKVDLIASTCENCKKLNQRICPPIWLILRDGSCIAFSSQFFGHTKEEPIR